MTNDELWQAVLGEIELSLSRANFITWFKNTFIIDEENNHIIIAVPNLFTKTWFEKKYNDLIIKILKKLTNNRINDVIYKIEIKKKELILEKINDDGKFPTTNEEIKNNTNVCNNVISDLPLSFNGLNPKYTFEKFIVGKSNELAHAAARAIAERPGLVYNPLFIYGGVGLGKTHLLQAVGHAIISRLPESKILYTTCEKFTNDFVNAIRTGKTKEFQHKYRDVDLLIVDDIQFIGGKQETQEQFFHAFNDLFQNNKQLIISSDRHPKAIQVLEERLRSRFECGMIADISEPDMETRMAIIRAKLLEKEYNLDEDIVNFIAVSVQSNIRELEGALNRIIAYHSLKKECPTIESVRPIISALINLPRKGSLSPKLIIKTVAEYFDISIEDVIGECRKKELVVPRQIIMYLLREELDYSFPNIGQELGGRDHTTAMHAYGKIKNQIIDNEKTKQDITLLKQKIFNNTIE